MTLVQSLELIKMGLVDSQTIEMSVNCCHPDADGHNLQKLIIKSVM